MSVRDVQSERGKLEAVGAHHFGYVEDGVAHVFATVCFVGVWDEACAAPYLKVARQVAVGHEPPVRVLEVRIRPCVGRFGVPEHRAGVQVQRAQSAVDVGLDEAVFVGAASVARCDLLDLDAPHLCEPKIRTSSSAPLGR